MIVIVEQFLHTAKLLFEIVEFARTDSYILVPSSFSAKLCDQLL